MIVFKKTSTDESNFLIYDFGGTGFYGVVYQTDPGKGFEESGWDFRDTENLMNENKAIIVYICTELLPKEKYPDRFTYMTH